MSRNYSLGGLLFASSARTTIPPTPTVGIPYRKSTLTASEGANGWPFSTVVDSADFNEVMYRITTVLDFVEKNGGITWSSLTDYAVGSLVRDDSFTFYEAIQASGPNNGGAKTPSTSTTYWKVATFHFYGGGYRVVFIGSDYASHSNELIYCRGTCTISLPTSPADQDRIKIATSETISTSLPVTITGAAIQRSGTTSVIMNEPISFVEFVWDATNSMWKIESLVCGGMASFVDSSILLVPPMNTVADTNTIALTKTQQQLSAALRVQSNMGLQTNSSGLGVLINPSANNAIHLVDGGLYSGQVDEDTIFLLEKQQVFFNGTGSQISLGELDVGTWTDDQEWPLPWDFGEVQFEKERITVNLEQYITGQFGADFRVNGIYEKQGNEGTYYSSPEVWHKKAQPTDYGVTDIVVSGTQYYRDDASDVANTSTFAWHQHLGTTVLYSKSAVPRVGDTVYSNSAGTTSAGIITGLVTIPITDYYIGMYYDEENDRAQWILDGLDQYGEKSVTLAKSEIMTADYPKDILNTVLYYGNQKILIAKICNSLGTDKNDNVESMIDFGVWSNQ